MLKHQQVHTMVGRRLNKGRLVGDNVKEVDSQDSQHLLSHCTGFSFFIKGGTFEGVRTEKQRDLICI